MANITELMNGWGFGKQTAIGTANASTAIWRQTNLNTKPWAKVPVNEDDRAEIGKGHEFPTQLFKSHYNMPTYELSKYASSEVLAWAMSFGLGNVTVSGSGPYTYVIIPALGATNATGLELPYFSFVQQIRPGGSAVLDEMLVGCALKGWKLSIKNSPGRASAMCSVECVTTGQYTSPSGITLPAVSTPHEFNAGMITALTFSPVVDKANAGFDRFEKQAESSHGKVIRISDQTRTSVQRLITSLEKQAETYGKSGVDRLITQRDQLLQRYNREPQAIDAITKSYEKMIAMEEKAARESLALKAAKEAEEALL